MLRRIQLVLVALAIAASVIVGALWWLKFPEHRPVELAELTEEEEQLAAEMASDVRHLAVDIGPRNVTYHAKGLALAAAFIEQEWLAMGYAVSRQTVEADAGPSDNLIIDLPGQNPEAPVVIIGAHYDTFRHSPGANDNASGVAALLALSRHLGQTELRWPLRLIAFTNEEPPEYQTESMGSIFYVDNLGLARVAMMMSLETIGYYQSRPETQSYPWPLDMLYSDVADFIGIVGDPGSRPLTREVLESFRRQSQFPTAAITLPELFDGTGWSDHWAFWRKKIPAVMLTDTAFFRYEFYHTTEDKIDHLNFGGMARVVSGLLAVLRDPAFDATKPYGFTGR